MLRTVVVLASLMLSSALVAGCGRSQEAGEEVATQRQPLTWTEFVGQAYLEPDTGVYIVNGDEPAEDLATLASFYQSYVQDFDRANGLVPATASKRQQLIVNTVSGADDAWSPAQAQDLTYCVSK